MDLLAHAAAAAAPAAAVPAAVALGGPTRISEEQRWACVALSKDGRSNRYIARHLQVNRATVAAILSRYAATGSPGSGSRCGRPRCSDEATDTNIAVEAHVTKFTSPKQIRRKLDLDLSPRTIDRRLQEAGLFGRVARRKRHYSAAERQKRLDFALAKFKSRVVTELLHSKGVTTLDFPPYSPDLNPIENLWAVLARAVEQRPPDTMEELQDRVAEEWGKVDKEKELLRSLAHSMPPRCAAVIEAEGWHTKY